MPEFKLTRIFSAVAFVSLAGVFTQSTDRVRAAEDCLSKPNSSAPQGQHWYYRMDHANGRQCWRLGPVGLRVQKPAPATIEKRSGPATATQSETSARPQRPVTTGHAAAESAPEINVSATAAVAGPAYWLDASRLLNQSSAVPPAVQQPSFEERSTGTSDTSPTAEDPPSPARSVVASAGDALPQTAAPVAAEPQRIAPSAKPATSIVDDDHTFALLLLMFVTLAIAGPMLHFSERRRRRLARPFQQPRWALTDTPNEPEADIEMPLAPSSAIDQSPEPASPFETEHLEKALQRLLDRLQTEHLSVQGAEPSARSTEIRMKKSA